MKALRPVLAVDLRSLALSGHEDEVPDAGDDFNPVWSPDGTHVAFASTRTGLPKIYVKPADGSGEERLLAEMPGTPTSWSSDGRYLLFTSNSPETGNDLWAIADPRQPSGTAKPFTVLATPFNEIQGQFSPDGRWIAYTSNESSAADIFVLPFSTDGNASAGGKWLVSSGGLSGQPRWSAEGRRLFYTSGRRSASWPWTSTRVRDFRPERPNGFSPRRHRSCPLDGTGGDVEAIDSPTLRRIPARTVSPGIPLRRAGPR